jgi:N-methylhydantoinase B
MDAVTLEVIYNSTAQVAHELTLKMMRTGYSTIIKESGDVTFAICDREAQLVAQHMVDPIHLGVIPAQVGEIIRTFGARIEPDDAFILNSPYRACQNHMSDTTLVSPVFYGGEIVAFVANTAHKPDTGGKVPGTNAGDATDLFQEGLVIPPVKLYRRGELNEDVYEFIVANTRTPVTTWGDTKAQALTNIQGAHQLVELLDRFGAQTVLDAWAEWARICEQEMRARIARLPAGRFGPLTDYMDDDGIELGRPLAISAALEKCGDELIFTLDSAPQARGPINVRPCIVRAVTEYVCKAVLAPHLPNNHGVGKPVAIHFPPEGHLINPRYPAPVNMYASTAHRVSPLIMGLMAQLAPDRAMAPSAGSNTAVSFNGADPRSGRRFSQYEILHGGYGARPTRDGIAGMAQDGSNVLNTPVEAIESEFPVRVERYAIRPDSGGPGEHRGGLGVRREWRVLADDVTMNLRGDRAKFASPGVYGGGAGQPGGAQLNADGRAARPLHLKAANVRLAPGDLVRLDLAGAAGWGPPAQRDPALVLRDVRAGYVTVETARAVYRVAVNAADWTVDEAETRALRVEAPHAV